jgi:hypothetical protein
MSRNKSITNDLAESAASFFKVNFDFNPEGGCSGFLRNIGNIFLFPDMVLYPEDG